MKRFFKYTAALIAAALSFTALSCTGQSSDESAAVLTDGTTSYIFNQDGSWKCNCDKKIVASGTYCGNIESDSKINIYFENMDQGSGLEECSYSTVIEINNSIYNDGDSIYTLK
ncbi:hypothetical protein [Treponema sp.]|uniref:hypothetical protein n=1 Tax=Treponema sp. TaxID=166 RepID=UPI0025CCC503|nr:hypothetical protein [Treponema sp.]MCR5217653.1 hypothetical protein [Treponema sp.]